MRIKFGSVTEPPQTVTEGVTMRLKNVYHKGAAVKQLHLFEERHRLQKDDLERLLRIWDKLINDPKKTDIEVAVVKSPIGDEHGTYELIERYTYED